MSRSAGTRLGPYEILAALGAGGMGEVYRARDTKLNREVALKILPDGFASDPDRLARFTREAQTLASLNHPNIAAIYGIEESQHVRALVMELVAGEDLSQQIARGAIPLDEALPIARQIADALETAHDQGIIHRDLKPANIKVRADGTVKVLDFGLAKALDPEGTVSADAMNSPTLSMHATQAGIILGTAAYMSPEQARGRIVDKRADVWAFGVVLYEMVTGRRLFDGETITDVIAAVLTKEPDLSAVPPPWRRLIGGCLKKDARVRVRDIGDVWLLLDDGRNSTADNQSARASRVWPWAVAALMAAAAVGVVGGLLLPRPGTIATTAGISRHLAIAFPAAAQFGHDGYVPFALSPDGTTLVYERLAPAKLFLRHLDAFDVRPLDGTDGANDPFFSPDGQWVGFWSINGTIRKVPVAGGPVVTLCQAEDMLGASWGDDGTIVFAPKLGSALFAVSAAGGTPTPVTTLDPARHEVRHAFPQSVLRGRAVLFTATSRTTDDPYSVEIQDRTTGVRRTLVRGARYGRVLPTGHLIYVRGQSVFAVRVDPHTLEPIGRTADVLESLAVGTAGQAPLSVSTDGTLAFIPGSPSRNRTFVWADRRGGAVDLGLPARPYEFPLLSPDGRRAAVSIPEAGRRDIWIYSIERQTLDRLTFDRTASEGFYNHVFTPEGTRLTYSVDAPGGFRVMSQAVDGGRPAEELLLWPRRIAPQSWHHDGHTLLLNELGAAAGGDVLVMRPGAGPPSPFVQEPGNQWGPRFSPDSRVVAYAGDESGRFEIYIRPYPGPGQKRQLTTDGGTEPVWSGDGRELFYRKGDALMAIAIATDPLQVGRPRLLFEGHFVTGAPGIPAYDVGPDGRFLMMRGDDLAPSHELRVVLNWFEELKQRVP